MSHHGCALHLTANRAAWGSRGTVSRIGHAPIISSHRHPRRWSGPPVERRAWSLACQPLTPCVGWPRQASAGHNATASRSNATSCCRETHIGDSLLRDGPRAEPPIHTLRLMAMAKAKQLQLAIGKHAIHNPQVSFTASKFRSALKGIAPPPQKPPVHVRPRAAAGDHRELARCLVECGRVPGRIRKGLFQGVQVTLHVSGIKQQRIAPMPQLLSEPHAGLLMARGGRHRHAAARAQQPMPAADRDQDAPTTGLRWPDPPAILPRAIRGRPIFPGLPLPQWFGFATEA